MKINYLCIKIIYICHIRAYKLTVFFNQLNFNKVNTTPTTTTADKVKAGALFIIGLFFFFFILSINFHVV